MKARGVDVLINLEKRLGSLPVNFVVRTIHPRDRYLVAGARLSEKARLMLNVNGQWILFADISMSAQTKIKSTNRPTTLFNLCSFYMKKPDKDLKKSDKDVSLETGKAIELDEKIWIDFESVHPKVLKDMMFGIDEHNRKNVQKFGYYRPAVMFNATDEDFVYGLASDFFTRYCHK